MPKQKKHKAGNKGQGGDEPRRSEKGLFKDVAVPIISAVLGAVAGAVITSALPPPHPEGPTVVIIEQASPGGNDKSIPSANPIARDPDPDPSMPSNKPYSLHAFGRNNKVLMASYFRANWDFTQNIDWSQGPKANRIPTLKPRDEPLKVILEDNSSEARHVSYVEKPSFVAMFKDKLSTLDASLTPAHLQQMADQFNSVSTIKITATTPAEPIQEPETKKSKPEKS